MMPLSAISIKSMSVLAPFFFQCRCFWGFFSYWLRLMCCPTDTLMGLSKSNISHTHMLGGCFWFYWFHNCLNQWCGNVHKIIKQDDGRMQFKIKQNAIVSTTYWLKFLTEDKTQVHKNICLITVTSNFRLQAIIEWPNSSVES